MKTDVILNSTDRNLFGITIKQSTKEQFLSVTDLQKAYETARWQYGWSERRIESVTQTTEFRERLFYVLESQGFIKTNILVFIEMLNKEGFTRTLKGLGVWKSTGARGNNQVMCNPYIWVLLALEMNPMIYAKVIVWLTDSLIFNRIEAGTEYLPMNIEIKKLIGNSTDYSKYATLINEKVFGQHQKGMRNLASAKELRKIADIEKFIINAIQQGWLKTDTDIVKAIVNYK
jgi:hypothetical protein